MGSVLSHRRDQLTNTYSYKQGKDFIDLSRATPALIIVDMQRAFVDPSGLAAIPGARELIPRINHLVEATHRASLPVIWIRSDYTPPVGGLTAQRYSSIAEHGTLTVKSTDGEFVEGLTVPSRGDDHVVVKHSYDAFLHTKLEWLLRNYGVDSVIVTGVASEVCCDTTLRSAYCRGFRPVMVSDATAAAFGSEHHETNLRTLERYFARVATTAVVAEELSQRVQLSQMARSTDPNCCSD